MTTASEETQERALQVVDRLAAAYPDSKCSLDFDSPFQLLIATILAAQCTDARVNLVTPALFARFPTPAAFAVAPLTDIEEAIRSTGFYRNKAHHIQAACQMILTDFNGEVPHTMAELLQLPGVARKTANVVMSNGFGQVEGVVVDTHVGRISRRLGLTASEDPVRVEQDLMALLPQSEWRDYNHRLIDHGRAVCKAPRPRCGTCMMTDICPSYDPNSA
ncbi:MAG TPA: endonuclease III [Chloroflexota bacterium]|nr:endonuclease III [Chloroflexota bacterium]